MRRISDVALLSGVAIVMETFQFLRRKSSTNAYCYAIVKLLFEITTQRTNKPLNDLNRYPTTVPARCLVDFLVPRLPVVLPLRTRQGEEEAEVMEVV